MAFHMDVDKNTSTATEPGSSRPPGWAAPVLALLVGLTSIAVGSLSVWLIPPYLAVMTLLLADFLPSRRREVASPGKSCDASTVESAPSQAVSEAATTTVIGQEAVETEPVSSGPAAVAVSPKRKRKRKATQESVAPAPARWVQVAPGKFVRVEADPTLPDPTDAESNEFTQQESGELPTPEIQDSASEELGRIEIDDDGSTYSQMHEHVRTEPESLEESAPEESPADRESLDDPADGLAESAELATPTLTSAEVFGDSWMEHDQIHQAVAWDESPAEGEADPEVEEPLDIAEPSSAWAESSDSLEHQSVVEASLDACEPSSAWSESSVSSEHESVVEESLDEAKSSGECDESGPSSAWSESSVSSELEPVTEDWLVETGSVAERDDSGHSTLDDTSVQESTRAGAELDDSEQNYVEEKEEIDAEWAALEREEAERLEAAAREEALFAAELAALELEEARLLQAAEGGSTSKVEQEESLFEESGEESDLGDVEEGIETESLDPEDRPERRGSAPKRHRVDAGTRVVARDHPRPTWTRPAHRDRPRARGRGSLLAANQRVGQGRTSLRG
jgi:hypothetical protein